MISSVHNEELFPMNTSKVIYGLLNERIHLTVWSRKHKYLENDFSLCHGIWF